MQLSTSNQADPAARYFGRDLEAMALARNYNRWIIALFRPFAGRRLVEVGAGCGNFTEFLLEGFHPESLLSLEPSDNMFPLLQNKFARHDVVRPERGCLAGILPAEREKADSIFYVNVLEHIKDDAAEIALARDALEPGGHLFIFVPALRWLFGSADRNFGHFRRYTRGGLRSLVEAQGFETRQCRHVDIAGVLPWWITFVLLRAETLNPGMVRLYDRWVVPVMRRVESLIPPPLGKNLFIAARKR